MIAERIDQFQTLRPTETGEHHALPVTLSLPGDLDAVGRAVESRENRASAEILSLRFDRVGPDLNGITAGVVVERNLVLRHPLPEADEAPRAAVETPATGVGPCR